eukprot:m.152707 g.152707  ORF g.152707 m.152707 type:complete len:601 (-) comp23408_c1_seq1:113-1915(-)
MLSAVRRTTARGLRQWQRSIEHLSITRWMADEPGRPLPEVKRLVVVGGVAGGASAAARARRLNDDCTITMIDRGPFVSFANCGLPFYVGDVIHDEASLIVATPERFRDRFNIDVLPRHEVVAIDRTANEVVIRDLGSVPVREFRQPYDALVLSPGARALRPPIPGIDLPGIFVLRTIPDSNLIREWMTSHKAETALVIGGGFIGLEMAENLAHRGMSVTMLELTDQVMPSLDPEVAAPIKDHMVAKGVDVRTAEGVTSFAEVENGNGAIAVTTSLGATVTADMVILAIGVTPDSELARNAGLDVGPRGGIQVDAHMRTNDDRIWAVGDAIETEDFVLKSPTQVPLAGPANRQGRTAADSIFGRHTRFRGVQGTAVCGAFGMVIASTGASEKSLRRAGRIAHTDYEVIYLHPGHHVGYYPGATPIHMKVIYDPRDGRLLGAQATGQHGVERRIDVVSMAIQMHGTVFDLEEAELCYAPQFGAAKDPVNMAGMIGANHIRGDHPIAQWTDPVGDAVLLDVRSPDEFAAQSVPGAINIPLEELRARSAELPMDRPIRVYCVVGQRAYNATRILLQRGFKASNLTGGICTYKDLGAAVKDAYAP